MKARVLASLATTLVALGVLALVVPRRVPPDRPRPGYPGWTTPLIRAAREGRADAVTTLTAAGADPNRYDTGPNGWTPLLHAVHTRQPETVRALIAAGADVNKPAPNGLTPLAMAANQGEAAIVDVLLAAGADPGAVSSHGWTALHEAVARGDQRIVQALLRKNPDLELGSGWRAWSVRGMAWVQGKGEVLDIVNQAEGEKVGAGLAPAREGTSPSPPSKSALETGGEER